MHTAAGTANLAVAEELVTWRGVDVNAQNKDNKTPYDVASSNKAMQKCIEMPEVVHHLSRVGAAQGMNRTPAREGDPHQTPGGSGHLIGVVTGAVGRGPVLAACSHHQGAACCPGARLGSSIDWGMFLRGFVGNKLCIMQCYCWALVTAVGEQWSVRECQGQQQQQC